MSEADKLFEEAGYNKSNNRKYHYDKAGLKLTIVFNGRSHSIQITMYDKDDMKEYPPELTILELKAINEKCKELGVVR